MLRFGSALVSGLQRFGNIEQANALFQQLIKPEPGQRLSSPKGVSAVRKMNSGEDEAETIRERLTQKVGRSLFPGTTIPVLNGGFVGRRYGG